jgi:hypothetical protein
LDQSGTASDYQYRFGGAGETCTSVPVMDATTLSTAFILFTTAANLIVGYGGVGRGLNTNAFLGIGAEL